MKMNLTKPRKTEKQGNPRKEFKVKESQHYNISVLINHHHDLDGYQMALNHWSIF